MRGRKPRFVTCSWTCWAYVDGSDPAVDLCFESGPSLDVFANGFWRYLSVSRLLSVFAGFFGVLPTQQQPTDEFSLSPLDACLTIALLLSGSASWWGLCTPAFLLSELLLPAYEGSPGCLLVSLCAVNCFPGHCCQWPSDVQLVGAHWSGDRLSLAGRPA